MSSSSDNRPDYGLEIETSDVESNITGPIESDVIELMEVLYVEPLNMLPPEQFEPQQISDEDIVDNMEEDEEESEPESSISEEEPSPLCRPPTIQVGALVYLKVEPLFSYEWKDEMECGRYLGPIRITARLDLI